MNIELSPMHQLLLSNGFESGWAISGETLLVWEHEEEPPAPLTRPAPLGDRHNGY